MFATLIAAAAFVAPALLVSANFNMASPAVNQCGQVHVTWDDTGKGPYNLVVLDAANPCGDPLVNLGDHDGTSMTWYAANLPQGTNLQFSVEDTTGNEAWSADTLVGGGDNSCLSDAQKSAASAASAKTTTTAAAGTTTTAKTTSSGGKTTAPAVNAGSKPTSVSVAGAISGASMASFSLPALALSAAVGFFTLL